MDDLLCDAGYFGLNPPRDSLQHPVDFGQVVNIQLLSAID